ncbi:MAG TPA: hypothetical protein VK721_04625 [Solirubrobacteraceae bacterium]|jgi:hypothetical protein|nr:hypothetical protein [Solirubrobacteraceae bacterium]
MTAAGLAAVVSSHQSNIKKEAGKMASEGLIRRATRRPANLSKRGPKPEAFEMLPAQRKRASEELAAYAPPGVLRPGQELIRAPAGPGRAVDLLRVLIRAEATARAAWVALVGDDLLVAYNGPSAAKPAVELQAVLEAANLESQRATVTNIVPAHEWLRDSQSVMEAVKRSQASA